MPSKFPPAVGRGSKLSNRNGDDKSAEREKGIDAGGSPPRPIPRDPWNDHMHLAGDMKQDDKKCGQPPENLKADEVFATPRLLQTEVRLFSV